jgi:hypothetical protein
LLHVYGVLEKVSGVLNIKARQIFGLPVERMLSAPAQVAGYDFKKCFDDHTVG